MPALSVLLPVRDAAPWLGAALGSLARQTFPDFEIVAVDDGSTDDSLERLRRAARREPRLRVFARPHAGLPATLAFALRQARAPLIARHDADDLSHRERFALQLARLAAAPRCDVVGTRVRLFPRAATGPGMRRWADWHNALLTHEAMERDALIDSPLAHGAALIRRDALERAGGWTERGWPEDLDLWLRLFATGARFAKLPRTLYGWRQHAAGATRRDPRYRAERYADLRLAALRTGFLAGRARVGLVGVGASLAAWGGRLERLGLGVERHALRRPPPGALPPPPLVLVFGARPARERWRAALAGRGLHESRDFVFVG